MTKAPLLGFLNSRSMRLDPLHRKSRLLVPFFSSPAHLYGSSR